MSVREMAKEVAMSRETWWRPIPYSAYPLIALLIVVGVVRANYFLEEHLGSVRSNKGNVYPVRFYADYDEAMRDCLHDRHNTTCGPSWK